MKSQNFVKNGQNNMAKAKIVLKKSRFESKGQNFERNSQNNGAKVEILSLQNQILSLVVKILLLMTNFELKN